MAMNDIPLRRALPLFLALYAPLVALVTGLGLWYVHERRDIALTHWRTEARHHVEGQVDRIRRFYRQGLLMVRGFARDSAVQPALRGDAAAREEMARVFANILRSLDALDQLRLLDARGREVVRVERRAGRVARVRGSALQDKSHRGYVRRALAMPPGGVHVSPLDVNMEHGRIERPYKAVIRFVAVVGDGRGGVAGLLAANFLGLKLMAPELNETRLPGEHLLVNAGSRWWFDSHRGHLAVWDGEDAMRAAHRLGDAWRRLMAARGASQLMSDHALLTLERYRPNGVHDPLHVPVHLHPVQREWRIVSYAPLPRAWTGAAVIAPAVAGAALLALAGAALLIWVRYRLWRRETARQREAMMRANQRLLRRLFRLREEERAHLARLMHDEIGQRLTGIQMQVSAAGARCRNGDCCKHTRTTLTRVRREIDDLVRLMRDQLRAFRPPPVRELGLTGAMRGYGAQWSRDTGIRCDVQVDAMADALPHACQIQLYRVMQEALTNVARHAGASTARLWLRVSDSEVRLVIEDDGTGFDPERAASGLGLAGMRERAQLLHGHLRLERTPAGGARVTLRAPVPNRGQENTES